MDRNPVRSTGPTPDERRRLLERIRLLSLKRGRFVLASGAISDTYLDLRQTTTDPEGARLGARFLLHQAALLGANRVGGPTLGADPLVGAAVALSEGGDLRGFIVRSRTKDHGTGRLIEGHLERGDRALVLDDVVTAGGSILQAVEAVRAAGAEVAGSFCLVDREQGGREKLAEAGAPLSAVFRLAEILESKAQPPLSPAPATAPSRLSAARPPETTPEPAASAWPPVTPRLTVDAILEIAPGSVLLVRRRHPPLGWALPGGFVEPGESAEEAVRREILEETGLVIESAVQFHTYSAPGRDPRFPTASVVFAARSPGRPLAGDDAAEVRVFALEDLPPDLCFDHGRILDDYRRAGHRIGPEQPPAS